MTVQIGPEHVSAVAHQIARLRSSAAGWTDIAIANGAFGSEACHAAMVRVRADEHEAARLAEVATYLKGQMHDD